MNDLQITEKREVRIWALAFDENNPERNTSTLDMDWPSFGLSGNEPQKDKLIAVTRKYPEYSNPRLKGMTLSADALNQVQPGDIILGVEEEMIVKKAGVAEQRRDDPYSNHRMTVEWSHSFRPQRTVKPIIKKNQQFQKLPVTSLKLLPEPAQELLLDYYNVPSITDIIRLSNVTPQLLFNPEFTNFVSAKFVKGEENTIANEMTVFYCTNRIKNDFTSPQNCFGDEENETPVMGSCVVSIPKVHVQGEVERPFNWIVFRRKEHAARDIVLSSVTQMADPEFIKMLRDGIAATDKKTALVFIHGYNVTFAEAARQTAQMAWDIPFNGIAGFFSWPSSGRMLDYFKDIEKADNSVTMLENFIEKIVTEAGIEKLQLIAHSMGNRILTRALNNLWAKESFKQKRPVIDQIVLAAADIDKKVFMGEILPAFNAVGNRRTIYSSDKDRALRLSKLFRGGRVRLGDAGRHIFVGEHFDTVNASDVKSGGTGHSYIFETRELLEDMYYLLENGFSPLQRRLRAISKDELRFWQFPH